MRRFAMTRQIAIILVLLFVGPLTAQAAKRPQSIESFLRLKKRWADLSGVSFRLEGRYSLFARTLVKFEKCELNFRSLRGEFPRISRESKTLEIFGHLSKKKGRVYFAVDTLKELPTDIDYVRKAERKLLGGEAREWYELGDWALGRSKFYKDATLEARARIVFLKGILLEKKGLPKDDEQALLTLKQKAENYQLDVRLLAEFLHEANWISWNVIRKVERPTNENRETLRKLSIDLVGSSVPLESLDDKPRVEYRNSPLTVYRDADDNTRKILHRLFRVEMLIHFILKDVADNGSNGFEIAKQIESQVPELLQVAESHRKKELDYRFSLIPTYRRRQMLELHELYRSRKNEKKARDTLDLWVKIQEQRLRKEGVEGLIDAARLNVELKQDRDQAIALLMEADRLVPGSKAIAQEFGKLSFVFKNGSWVRGKESVSVQDNDFSRAMREGIIIIGMTTEHVRKVLGAPKTIARLAVEGRMREAWVYQLPSGKQLTIHFSRQTLRPTGKVIAQLQTISRWKIQKRQKRKPVRVKKPK